MTANIKSMKYLTFLHSVLRQNTPSLVMASYCLQTISSQLLWVARVCHHRNSGAEVPTCPSCSWPHITLHTVALPWQLYPYATTCINVVATHTQFKFHFYFYLSCIWDVLNWWWCISVKISPS